MDRNSGLEEYTRFVSEVLDSGKVWEVRSRLGRLAYPSSLVAGRMVSVFFSDHRRADDFREAAQPDYENYGIVPLSLEEFTDLLQRLSSQRVPWQPEETVRLNMSETEYSVEVGAARLLTDIGRLTYIVRTYKFGLDQAFDEFVEQVRMNMVVWLVGTFENPLMVRIDGSDTLILLTWGDRNAAQELVSRMELQRTSATFSVTVGDFVDLWIPRLIREGVLVGPNWSDDRAVGLQKTPWQVLARLVSRPWDFFLSYASEDEAMASSVFRALRVVGARVWYQPYDAPFFHPHRVEESRVLSIVEGGIQHSRCPIFVISPSFIEKAWPRREVNHVLKERGRLPSSAPLFVIWVNVDPDSAESSEIRRTLRELRSVSSAHFRSDQAPKDIARLMVEKAPPRAVLKMEKFSGATRLMVDPRDGRISIINFSEPEDFTSFSSIEYEFSGRKLSLLAWHNDLESLHSRTSEERRDSVPEFSFAGPLAYFQVNRRLCSQQDVENGAFINLPKDKLDRAMRPIFVAHGVTIGVMTPDIKAELDALLERARGSFSDTWRRIWTSDGEVKVDTYGECGPPELEQI